MRIKKKKEDCHIVSPSGNLYGSEQVLWNFLNETKHLYTVYVPSNSLFSKKLESMQQTDIKEFSNVKFLYSIIAFKIILGRIKSLYINEGGHVRYIKILARLFPKVRFCLHVRIIEDTRPERLKALPSNVHVFAISKFIAKEINNSIQNVSIIYDPYKINGVASPSFNEMKSDNIHIGVVGRVTPSKGLKEIVSFCNHLESLEMSNITMHFFGDIDFACEDVQFFYQSRDKYHYLALKFHGFVESKNVVYNKIDILVHFNRNEPLGRVFFEALDFGIPVIGFDSGGIGEIAQVLGLQEQMVKFNNEWEKDMLDKALSVTRGIESSKKYANARLELAKQFSSRKYCERLESYIL